MKKHHSSKRSPRRLIALVALAVGLLMAVPAAANALTVYAASSLREAFPKMAPANTYNFSGSNELQLQIEHGAPADVFASAAPEEAQALFREGLCTRPVTFATNTVVLWVPNGNQGNIKSVYNLRGGGRTLAVGALGVSIGSATLETLPPPAPHVDPHQQRRDVGKKRRWDHREGGARRGRRGLRLRDRRADRRRP